MTSPGAAERLAIWEHVERVLDRPVAPVLKGQLEAFPDPRPPAPEPEPRPEQLGLFG